MRILIIHQHDPAINHVGGVGTYINTFIKYAPSDFQVSLVGVTTDSKKRPLGKWQQLTLDETTFDYLPLVAAHPTYHGRVPLSLSFTWELLRKRRQIDFKNALVELHRIEPELALRDIQGCRKVLFFHTHSQDLYHKQTEVFWKHFPWAYFALEKMLIRNMAQCYSVREDLIGWYHAKYPGLIKNFIFVPTWVDEDVFRSMPEADRRQTKEDLAQQYGLDPASKWILFVGRFEQQKDPFLLLKSFQALNRQLKDTQLIMIGGGSMETEIRSWIESHHLANMISLIKPQSQSDIAAWMNASDCLALSSAYEGMPRAVLEALQCGLPVVAVDEGETARLVTSPAAGCLVKTRDPETFSQSMAWLLGETPDRAACQSAARPFGAKKILDELFASYRALQKEEMFCHAA